MFCYKLKSDDKHTSRFVEGIKIFKFEWYCVEKENIKLKNNILVDNDKFKGFQIPDKLVNQVNKLKEDVIKEINTLIDDIDNEDNNEE